MQGFVLRLLKRQMQHGALFRAVISLCLSVSAMMHHTSFAQTHVIQDRSLASNRGEPGNDSLRRADAAFKAGYAAMQSGNLEEARKNFAEAVRLAPRIPESHVALGIVLAQLGHAEEAIHEFELTLKLRPGDAMARMNLSMVHETLAQRLAAAGKFSEAEREMRTALGAQLNPGSPAPSADAARTAQLEDELGSVLAQQRQWAQAEAAFRESLRLNPDPAASAGPHMHLGIVLLEERQAEVAITNLQQAVNGAPQSSMAHFELGRGLGATGHDEEAVKQLLQADTLVATHKEAAPQGLALELAMAEQRLGRQQESIPYFQKAIEMEPRNATALTNLGLALTQTGKAGEAMPYFQRALKESPKDPTLLEDIGVAELQQSHFEEAISRFEWALLVDKDNPQLHYDLGLAYKLKDRMEDAVRELQQAIRLDPTLPDPPYTLGILYMQMGKLEDAVNQMRAALTVRPENGDGWAILGSTLKQAGRQSEAEEALRKAIALLPSQPGPHITLAGVLAEEGKHDEATAERKIAAGLSRTAVSRQRATFSTNAGNQLLLRGDIEGAVGRYQEAINADPDYSEAHAQLAVAYERQGRTADAQAEHEKAKHPGKVD